MDISNHRLKNDGTQYRETPNKGGLIEPQYLVFHFTSGRSAQSSIDWLCNPAAKASAHIVLARDGSITQLAPFNVKTWHAGKSSWNGLSGLNAYSIGIEIDNAGRLTKVGSKYRAWFQGEYPEDEVIHARHKHEQDMSYWHVYTEEQITLALELAGILVKTYGLKDILGHDDIAPTRKSDPGPAFPLTNIKAKVLGRSEEESDVYEVVTESLNIRRGPGVEYETVSSPLPQGTRVNELETNSRWSLVEVQGSNDIEAWVCSKYLRKV